MPDHYTAEVSANGWSVYRPEGVPELSIAVFSSPELGLLVLFPGEVLRPQSLLEELQIVNPDPATLTHEFCWLDGRPIRYDTGAPKGTWVIEGVDNAPVIRDYDAWPQVTGDPPLIAFDRRP